jgi:large-conductance mechanosensitive channel
MAQGQECKTLAMRGNAIDLAVAVGIGAAVSSVVNSLMKNSIAPPLGFFLGRDRPLPFLPDAQGRNRRGRCHLE